MTDFDTRTTGTRTLADRMSEGPIPVDDVLRYATLLGIKQAKNKELRKVTLDEVKAALGENMQKIEKLYVPQKSKNTEFLEGPPAEVAKKLVERLRNEVRVI